MAQQMSVRLTKGDAPNWGFRLQGGKDFGTALVIQKVNGGSPAERAGLIAGDSVIRINNTEVFNLRHKDAQDVIVRAGPAFEITVQRGGSTWKPAVTPVGSYPAPSPAVNNVAPVTKTSLAAQHQSNVGAIGTGHNVSAKPFNTVNGTSNGTGPKLVNKQYNSPVGLYSEQSIAETLSAQTEVLSTGALGVNFKKNEKNYDATNSAVYRMLQEAEKDPRDYEPEPDSGVVTVPGAGIAGLRHVVAPENKAQPPKPQLPPGQNICADCERLIVGVFVRIKDKNLHVECFKCATCGSSLKNVGYYNINNKLYCDVHAKLAARSNPAAANLVPVTVPPGGRVPAGTISAALAGHNLPTPSPLSPSSNSVAAPFSPEEATNIISKALAKKLTLTADRRKEEENEVKSYLTSDVALNNTTKNKMNGVTKKENELVTNNPQSYITEVVTTVNNPKAKELAIVPIPATFIPYTKPSANLSGPRPFSSVNAPLSPPVYKPAGAPLSPVYKPAGAPLSPVVNTAAPGRFSSVKPKPSSAPFREKGRYVNIVWPPIPDEPELPTASPLYFPPPSQIISDHKDDLHDFNQAERDEELTYMAQNCCPKMSLCSAEVTNFTERKSAVECAGTISESLQTQVLVEGILRERPKSPPPIDKDITTSNLPETPQKPCETCPMIRPAVELKRPIEFQQVEKTTSHSSSSKMIENAVPKKWESQMVQALTTVSDSFSQIPSKHSTSAFASALSIAPREPFMPMTPTTLDPVPLPEETEPYFPPDHPLVIEPKPPKVEKPDSPFVKALQTAPERAYTPIGGASAKRKKQPDPLFKDLPPHDLNISMLTALTTASDRPYSPLMCELPTLHKDEPVKVEPKPKPKPIPQTGNPVPKPFKPVTFESFQPFEEKERPPSCQFPPVSDELKSSHEYHADYSQVKSEISSQIIEQTHMQSSSSEFQESMMQKSEQEMHETKVMQKTEVCKQQQQQIMAKQDECTVMRKPLNLVSCLHKPESLPSYQLALDALPIPMDFAQKKHSAVPKIVTEQVPAGRNPQIHLQNPDVCQQNPLKKPVTTLQPGEHNPDIFKPVGEDHAPRTSFSPRPGSLTPSMINKPAPKIPYYQVNLVATEFLAPDVNLFDPKSPAVSRSPSPCPGAEPSSSPFRPKSPRPKSPAPGPPPNPLKAPPGVPIVKEDKQLTQAKKSITTFIPQHKEIMEKQMYTAQVQLQNTQFQEEQMQSCQQEQMMQIQSQQQQQKFQSYQQESLMKAEAEKHQLSTSAIQGGHMTTSISDKSKMEQMQQLNKQQMESVEKSADNSIQIQRKKTVTEEYEHTHKERVIEIQKNATTTKTYPFQNTTGPALDPPIPPGHTTCPQRLEKRQSSSSCAIETQGIIGMKVTCPQPIVSPFITGNPQKTVPQTQAPPTSKPSAIPRQVQTAPSNHKQVTFPNATPSSSNQSMSRPNVPLPNTGTGGGRQAGAIGVAPKRGRGVLNVGGLIGARVPLCGHCHQNVRGPFITALGKIWCPNHFCCATPSCKRPLQDIGFIEERGQLYCEYCFEQYLAPPCSKCNQKIKGDCLKAIGKNFHPECFNCSYCGKLFGNSPFFLEDGAPYCEADWNQLFTTKCFACGFPVEAGDRWVEALNNNYHSQCFNCTMCKKNLEGQSFFAKGGRPFCKNHAR